MTADATGDDAWMETCFVSIAQIGGSDVHFGALTETIDFDGEEKDIEGIPNVAGGRITKIMAQSDAEITMEVYALQAGTHSGTTGNGFYDLLYTSDGTQGISITNDRVRKKCRLAILWTDDNTVTSAAGATGSSAKAFRLAWANGYFTKVKESFTDGILKATITFKCVPFNKAGTDGNFIKQSSDGSAALSAFSGYSTSNNF